MKMNYSTKTNIMRVFVYSFLVLLVVLCIIPIWMLLVNATRSTAEIQQGISIIPSTYTISNWNHLVGQGLNIVRAFFNSVFVSVTSTVLTVYFSMMAAYGIIVYNFKGKKLAYNSIILIVLIPMQLSIIGYYRYLATLGLTNTYAALILPSIAVAQSVFFAKQYLESLVLKELIDAARIDGCSEFTIFNKIMLPIAVPGAATMAIMAFVKNWNDFFRPFILITSQDKYTLPMIVQTLRGSQYREEYGAIYLGLAITVVPTLIVYAIFSKRIVNGMSMGAIKG